VSKKTSRLKALLCDEYSFDVGQVGNVDVSSVLLKLTIESHEASQGLFVTAELLVHFSFQMHWSFVWLARNWLIRSVLSMTSAICSTCDL